MRSRWKNDYISSAMWACIRHAQNKKTLKKKKQYKPVTNSRSTTVLPVMNGHTFWVHNGRILRPVEVKPFMFGTKLGDYVQTSELCVYRKRKNKKGKKQSKQVKSKKK